MDFASSVTIKDISLKIAQKIKIIKTETTDMGTVSSLKEEAGSAIEEKNQDPDLAAKKTIGNPTQGKEDHMAQQALDAEEAEAVTGIMAADLIETITIITVDGPKEEWPVNRKGGHQRRKIVGPLRRTMVGRPRLTMLGLIIKLRAGL